MAKIAVITGAAQGIGRRVAEVFAEAGYQMGLADLRVPAETIGAVTERGAEAIALVGDISDEATVEKFSRNVLERSRGGFPARAGSEFGGSVFAVESVGESDDRARVGQHRKCVLYCRSGWSGRPRGIQRFETWIDWIDANAGGGVGRARCARECRVSGLGENGNGSSGPSGRKLYGCGHYRTRAHGTICHAG